MDEPTVFAFSVQGARNFPCYTETSALDIELPNATGDTAYIDAPERGVRHALPAAQRELEILLAGADRARTIGRAGSRCRDKACVRSIARFWSIAMPPAYRSQS